jgi:hypothetical protein
MTTILKLKDYLYVVPKSIPMQTPLILSSDEDPPRNFWQTFCTIDCLSVLGLNHFEKCEAKLRPFTTTSI